MGSVTGHWAVALMIVASVPTMTMHLLDHATLPTIIWRTCIAAVGSFVIGLGVEWCFRRVVGSGPSHSPMKGLHLDVKVGPTDQEQMSVQDVAPEKGDAQTSKGAR